MDLVVDSSIIMRPRDLSNEAAVYELIDKNRAYLSQWVPWAKDYTHEKLHQDILDTYQETADGTLYIFDVFYNGEFAGAVDAHDVVAGKSAELGYYIGENFANKGLATNCTQALINFLVEHIHISYAYMDIMKGNAASIRVATKLGFTYANEHINDGITWIKYEKYL
jgi:ribosomal-protein-serine acetyltransferase